MSSYYVSVTGLILKSSWYYPKFMYYAVPSTMQAQKAEGNVSTRVTAVNGVQHTLTVWENKKAMRKYMLSGAHRKAMAVSGDVADLESIKVYGYESDTIPSWDEALGMWAKHGKVHGKASATRKLEAKITSTPKVGEGRHCREYAEFSPLPFSWCQLTAFKVNYFPCQFDRNVPLPIGKEQYNFVTRHPFLDANCSPNHGDIY
eukprot:scaffold12369_cov97-Cylindrotheca_fusiformis.AAC.2